MCGWLFPKRWYECKYHKEILMKSLSVVFCTLIPLCYTKNWSQSCYFQQSWHYLFSLKLITSIKDRNFYKPIMTTEAKAFTCAVDEWNLWNLLHIHLLDSKSLSWGVPQGFVLGHIIFLLNFRLLGLIFKQFSDVSLHFYDDNQFHW